MKVPIVTCPKCGTEIEVNISDKDIVLLLAKRLKVEVGL